MRARIEPLTGRTLARAAQLTQKTNQFNLTTRRYTEQQLSEMIESPDRRALTIQLLDRFGDNGIVGLAIFDYVNGRCEIDTFLLSCRVIGRTVETALFSVMAKEASAAKLNVLAGWFIPTAKNSPAAGFYAQHGFVCVRGENGATYWEAILRENPAASPPWIALMTGTESNE